MAEDKLNVLLVEGTNDLHVVKIICGNYKIPEVFDVETCGSYDSVLKQLEIRLKSPLMYERMGVLVDADCDVESSWDAIRNRLLRTGKYDVSHLKLAPDGLVINPLDKDYPIVGVWIMPNNQSSGMLEDFVMSLTDKDDPLMMKSEDVLTEIEKENINKYKEVHRSKAKVYTYLAWQNPPGLPMGQAISSLIFNPSLSTGKVFVEWLKRLFL